MDDYQEIFVPSASTYAWVMQNLEQVCSAFRCTSLTAYETCFQIGHSDKQYDSASSPPETPSLYWDSQPSTAELPEAGMHSVFEDWDDDAASANTYASAVILEDDGAQTVVIPPESAFYLPPSPIKPFGYVFDDDEPLEAADSEDIDKVPSVTLTPPNTSAVKGFARDRDSHILNLKGLVLHINTAFYPSAETPLTSMFSTSAPRVSDDASWAPKCKPGPDVPLDCICTGDISPSAEAWEEGVCRFTYVPFAVVADSIKRSSGPP